MTRLTVSVTSRLRNPGSEPSWVIPGQAQLLAGSRRPVFVHPEEVGMAPGWWPVSAPGPCEVRELGEHSAPFTPGIASLCSPGSGVPEAYVREEAKNWLEGSVMVV